MVYPALMAAAVGELYGMTGEEITRGVKNFLPTKMRMNVMRLPGDVVVLNDAYNANPQSMRAAAAVLGDAKDRRKVAIVGDMLELGPSSDLFHRAVGRVLGEMGDGLSHRRGRVGPLSGRGGPRGRNGTGLPV